MCEASRFQPDGLRGIGEQREKSLCVDGPEHEPEDGPVELFKGVGGCEKDLREGREEVYEIWRAGVNCLDCTEMDVCPSSVCG